MQRTEDAITIAREESLNRGSVAVGSDGAEDQEEREGLRHWKTETVRRW